MLRTNDNSDSYLLLAYIIAIGLIIYILKSLFDLIRYLIGLLVRSEEHE